MKDIEVIKELVSKFRSAIDQLKKKKELSDPIVFDRFPEGCCGDASELLWKYLFEYGIKTEYVCSNGIKDEYLSEINKPKTHAWLEYNSYVIDITLDQFEGMKDKKVFITKDKEWHLKLKELSRHSDRDFQKINTEYNKERLNKLYNKITTQIKKYPVNK